MLNLSLRISVRKAASPPQEPTAFVLDHLLVLLKPDDDGHWPSPFDLKQSAVRRLTEVPRS